MATMSFSSAGTILLSTMVSSTLANTHINEMGLFDLHSSGSRRGLPNGAIRKLQRRKGYSVTRLKAIGVGVGRGWVWAEWKKNCGRKEQKLWQKRGGPMCGWISKAPSEVVHCD